MPLQLCAARWAYVRLTNTITLLFQTLTKNAIVIGLLAITATIIYYAIFAPKPDDQFKSFLKREAAPVGSWYDGQDLNAEYLAKEAEAKKKYDEMTAKKKEAQKPAT